MQRSIAVLRLCVSNNKLLQCQTQKHLSLSAIKSSASSACPVEHVSVKPDNWSTAKPFEDVPGPKPLPVIGNAWWFLLMRDFNKLSLIFRKRYGDVAVLKTNANFSDILFLMNVTDIEWMLRNEGQYPKRKVLPSSLVYRHEIRKDLFGETYGLLNGQNEDWGTFRTTVNPIMMQPRVTIQYISDLNAIADEFLVHVQSYKEARPDGEMPADFLQELNKWAFESIVYIALDTRLGCLGRTPSEQSKRAIQYIQKIAKLSTDLDLHPFGYFYKKYKTKTWHDYIKYQDFFTELVLDLVNELDHKMKQQPEKPEHDKSVFEKLVAKDKKIAMVMTLDMLAAGIETTGKATAAALYFLAKNKSAQEKLREELVRLLPSKDSPLNKTILEDAKYLKAALKETMRISPIAHSTVRETTKDMVLGGYQVPSGVMVMMPHIYLTTGTDEHFSDPLEFRPERWLRGGKQENVNAFAALPFGFGARSCIGKRMAQMEMEILVSKMVRNFYLDWTHKDMRFKQEMAYGIADPLKIRLTDVPK